MKRIILFLVSLMIAAVAVVVYFKITQKISTISVPVIPSVSFSDLVKFSRFSLEKAPTQSLVGKILVLEGEVKHEGRLSKDSEKIDTLKDIQQGEGLETGEDGRVILSFDKISEVTIFSDTSLSIIQTLPADLVFSQNKGSAQFKKIADTPVSIRSLHLLIENKGDVKVSVDKLKPIVKVEILSGSATVAYNNINNDTRVLDLEKGETLTFNDDTRRVVQE